MLLVVAVPSFWWHYRRCRLRARQDDVADSRNECARCHTQGSGLHYIEYVYLTGCFLNVYREHPVHGIYRSACVRVIVSEGMKASLKTFWRSLNPFLVILTWLNGRSVLKRVDR